MLVRTILLRTNDIMGDGEDRVYFMSRIDILLGKSISL